MKRLLQHYDKILLVLCVLGFLATAFWATVRFRRIEEVAALTAQPPPVPAAYEPQPIEMPQIQLVSWPEPPAQSPPRRWVYDAFTPPVIYYNPVTHAFTDIQPETRVQVAAAEEVPFEVELVSVRREPYRIQLVGYTGNASDYLAQLQVLETGEVELGRPGKEFDASQGHFTLRSFEVRQVTTNTTDSMPVIEEVGFAVILDGQTGREVELTTRERLMLPRLQCVLRSKVYPTNEHILREGMKVTVNGYDYLVVQLSLDPAQAVVSRKNPAEFTGETRTLFPVAHTGSALTPAPDFDRLEPPAVAGQFHRLPAAFHVSD